MMDIVETLLARLRLVVGRCVLTATKYKDNELLSDVELVAGEKRRGLDYLQQYGFSSRPKGEVEGVALFVGGSRENGVVVATRSSNANLEEGEVKVHSPFGSSVYLKKDGSVEIESAGNVIVKTGNSIGKLRVEGGIEATQDVKSMCDSAPVSLSAHTHASCAGQTLVPTPSP
jgi:phage gp45-like